MDYKNEELETAEQQETLANSYYDDNDLPNENEPVEEPASGLSNIVGGAVNNVKAQAKKEVVAALLKNPYFWIISGLILLILLIAILIFQLDFDLFGVGNIEPEYYAPPACGRVYLTWENASYTEARKKVEKDYTPITDASLIEDLDEEDEYGVRYTHEEYDYDTYITSIVWNDNNNEAKDVDNEVVYEAMSIAARSRLIANLPDNCVVLKNYDEQAKSFTKLNGTEEKYTEISQAVTNTQGMIIGRDREIISAKYDAFSYTYKRKENIEGYENHYFYHMMNENEERQQVILAEWIEDLEKDKGVKIKKKVPQTKKLESLSLYGAKYLLEMTDSQYELYRILEYYYGRDIEYYTIDYAFSSAYNSDCSDISMSNTSLSRDEFIALAERYGNGRGGDAKVLAENAGMIYDMATSNGINPELVLIRASNEGFSPGGSTYNYWGIGCTNTGGASACHSYRSISEGVSAFLQYVSKYSSVTDLMSKYAYIGKYWYNPGSWSTGGCVYAEYIYDEIPARVKEACSSSHPCTTAHESTCVATTAEDQEAYAHYQVQTMVKARKTIFGLDADTCVTNIPMGEPGSGSCTIWKQGDARWGSIKLGTSKLTMKDSGCAVTSLAIAISCSGTTINSAASFNPGTLVNRMNTTGGFSGADIVWGNSAVSYYAPNFHYVSSLDARNMSGTASQKVAEVTNRLGTNTSILLHFINEKHPRGHWVVLKSISGTTFTVYDPAGSESNVNTYRAEDLDGIRVYKY